jgi:hypothetical protein
VIPIKRGTTQREAKTREGLSRKRFPFTNKAIKAPTRTKDVVCPTVVVVGNSGLLRSLTVSIWVYCWSIMTGLWPAREKRSWFDRYLMATYEESRGPTVGRARFERLSRRTQEAHQKDCRGYTKGNLTLSEACERHPVLKLK